MQQENKILFLAFLILIVSFLSFNLLNTITGRSVNSDNDLKELEERLQKLEEESKEVKQEAEETKKETEGFFEKLQNNLQNIKCKILHPFSEKNYNSCLSGKTEQEQEKIDFTQVRDVLNIPQFTPVFIYKNELKPIKNEVNIEVFKGEISTVFVESRTSSGATTFIPVYFRGTGEVIRTESCKVFPSETICELTLNLPEISPTTTNREFGGYNVDGAIMITVRTPDNPIRSIHLKGPLPSEEERVQYYCESTSRCILTLTSQHISGDYRLRLNLGQGEVNYKIKDISIRPQIRGYEDLFLDEYAEYKIEVINLGGSALNEPFISFVLKKNGEIIVKGDRYIRRISKIPKTATAEFSVKYEPGEYCLNIRIKRNGNAETDFLEKCITVNPSEAENIKPDIVIENFGFRKGNRNFVASSDYIASAFVGDIGIIDFVVKNIGNLRAVIVPIEISLTRDNGFLRSEIITFSNMNKGHREKFTYKGVIFGEEGNYCISIKVDPENRLKELLPEGETNNNPSSYCIRVNERPPEAEPPIPIDDENLTLREFLI